MRWNRKYAIRSYIGPRCGSCRSSRCWSISCSTDHARHRRLAGADRTARRDGRVPGPAHGGSAVAARDGGHDQPLVPRIHVRLAARRDPGRGRPVHAADHRDDAAAGQRDPIHRRLVRLHPGLRPAGVDADGTRRSISSTPSLQRARVASLMVFSISSTTRHDCYAPSASWRRWGSPGLRSSKASIRRRTGPHEPQSGRETIGPPAG